MKKLLTAFILGIALTGAAFAQVSSKEKAKVKMAVIEFSPASNASEMTPEAKRTLQTTLAAALVKTDRFDVADVRWTRNESQANLATLNNDSSTAAAVKLGKTLGVSYVLTGTVEEYTPKGADGFGRVILKVRLIEVSTGKVKHTDEVTQRGTGEMRTTGVVETQAKVVKPAIEKITAAIAELKL